MKNFKLNIAFLVAILATGITFTTQASFFGKRVITRCFTQVSLKNAAGTQTGSLNGTGSNPPGCVAAKAQVTITRYISAAVVATSLPSEESCPPNVEVFCCVKVTEILSTDPGYASTPSVDLGEGLKKYKILDETAVFCKLQLTSP